MRLQTSDGRFYEVTDGQGGPPTSQMVELAKIKLGIAVASGCVSCAGKANQLQPSGLRTLAACDTTLTPPDTTRTLTANVTSGTAPYTYAWVIHAPSGTQFTHNIASFSYTFSETGAYSVSCTVTDSCPDGALNAQQTCTVTVGSGGPTLAIQTVTVTNLDAVNAKVDFTASGAGPATLELTIDGAHAQYINNFNGTSGSFTTQPSNPTASHNYCVRVVENLSSKCQAFAFPAPTEKWVCTDPVAHTCVRNDNATGTYYATQALCVAACTAGGPTMSIDTVTVVNVDSISAKVDFTSSGTGPVTLQLTIDGLLAQTRPNFTGTSGSFTTQPSNPTSTHTYCVNAIETSSQKCMDFAFPIATCPTCTITAV